MAGFVAAIAWWTQRGEVGASGVEPHATSLHSPPARESVVLTHVRSTSARVSSAPLPAPEFACLEDGHASVSGVVLDEDGIPSPGARVAILGALHEADALAVRGETVADELGRFDVRTAKLGDVWITAFAPGLRPATHRCGVEAGFLDLAQPLQLERGVALSGRVTTGDNPLARVELEVLCPNSARRVRIGEHELALIGSRLEWALARGITADDGTWAFRGLAPERRIVRPHAFRCPTAVFPPGALASVALEAPASEVDLRIPSARLAVDVVADGEPLAWAEVEVAYRGLRGSRRADARGRLEIDVSPNEGLAVVVRAPGREPTREWFAGPRHGETRAVRVAAGPLVPTTKAAAFRVGR